MNAPTRTLLIADDEPCIQETTRFILESEGFAVLTARNGEEALAVVRRDRPRVVLLDVMMPKLDGYSVCREIRRDPALDGTFVIFLTAKGFKADENAAYAAGANAFFCKPVDDEQLVATIEAAFSAE